MKVSHRFVAILATAFLILAVFSKWPYGFYILLRLFISFTALYLALYCHEHGKKLWTWLFGAMVALFNPIIPIRANRSDWMFLDSIGALIFLCWIFSSYVIDKVHSKQLER